MQDPQILYHETLSTSFEKIKKALPKKLKPLKDTIVSFKEQIKTDKQLDANKYFSVYKLCIESKDAKLIEYCINTIYKLVANSFLTGNSSDIASNEPGSDGQNGEINSNSKTRRRLVDTIIESVCSCKNDKNENIQMQIVRILWTMVTGLTSEVHGASLRETLDTLFSIYAGCKNPENQVVIKAAITQVTNIVFQRMEEHNAPENEFRIRKEKSSGKKTTIKPIRATIARFSSFDPNSSEVNPTIHHRMSLDVSPQRFSLPTHSILPLSPSSAVNGTFASVLEQMNGDYDIGSPMLRNQPNDKHEKYFDLLLKNLVDDVCIYHKKIEDVKREDEKIPSENTKFELEHISQRSVPFTSDPADPHYRSLRKVTLNNERGIPAGIFGWCFICRETANLYCKDTRVPVCSVDCKLKHLEELENLNKPVKTQEALEKTMYIEDAVQIFDYLCVISGKDKANDPALTSLKIKTFSLELINSILANAGNTFLSAKDFRQIVKESLCGSILNNSVSTDKPTFAYSIEIFTYLMSYFKETLKAEVGVFIENILIHMLESGNSSYNHKYMALQVLNKLTSGSKIVLEFYVNYDCNMNSTNLVEQIVEILCKIAQGKFLRPEYSSLILPFQEQHLKTLSLESLVTLVKSLVQLTHDHQKSEKKRLEEANGTKKVVSLDNEKDFEEKDSSDEEDNNRDVSVFEKEGEIENQRKLKKELHKAIEKFNFKIKHGMKSLAQLGFIDLEDEKSVATFFKNTPGLSKEKIGEYFGEEHEFNIRVLTEWMDLLEFAELTLDDALRKLLKLFILPGESQKIDRILQIFASKYFKDNPRSFNSTNAAYTLSYLLIMLQTDAHSPQIKEKDRMKLPSFIKLAKGINDGQDLSEEELTGYYNRILETPLGIHTIGEAKKMINELQGQSIKRKEKQFQIETVKMLVKGQEIIRQKQDDLYYKVKNTDYVRPLFKEIIWSPVLAVFSVLLEKSEDPKIIQLCVDGFTNCVILTGMHNMDTERDTFVSSLAKFTNLTALREIKEKNAKCLEAILQLASAYGNLLRMSWLFVLECISKIDYYLNYLQNHKESEYIKNETVDQIEHSKSEIIKEIVDVHSINCVFSRSSSFELEEIMDFITCICKTADEELKNPQNLSTYSLQKLVEVAHFNLDRIKFIWTQIWNVTREYISHVAINSTTEIAFFAVDSLKQLSLKFLIKEELASLEFQKEFLRPFGTIFLRVENNDIKELILSCCSYIISHVGHKLKSGWKSILDILGLGAESEKRNIIQFSFQIAENIMANSLDSLKELLSEFIVLLIKFSRCKVEEVAIKSLEYLKKMISKLIHDAGAKPLDAEQDTILEESKSDQEIETELKREDSRTKQTSMQESNWITLLTSLFTLCSDSKKKIRGEGTFILFEILKRYGGEFSVDFWQVILSGVIKPLFDEVQYYFQSRNEEELLSYNDSCREIFSNMIDVYYVHYDKLSSFTEDFLKILMHCIDNPKGNLAKISINSLKQFITQCHTKFSDKEWSMMVHICSEIVKNTTPYQLLEFQAGPKPSARGSIKRKSVSVSSEESLTQCIVQLLMIALIKDVADTYDQYLTNEQLESILETLNASYQFAKNFNEQLYLRFCLWKNGLMKEMDQLPGLLKQGKEALGAYILILYKLYQRKATPKDEADALEKKKYLGEFLSLGFSLMSTVCNKGEEYFQTVKDKDKTTIIDNPGVESPLRVISDPYNFEDQVLRDSFLKQSDKLAMLELEKEIMHARTILSLVFLPKLAEINPAGIELAKRKELTIQLTNLAPYCIPKQLVFGDNFGQFSKIYAANDECLVLIRIVLNKYFEYAFSNMKG